MIVGLIGPYPCPLDGFLDISIHGKVISISNCNLLNYTQTLPADEILSQDPTPLLPSFTIKTSLGTSRVPMSIMTDFGSHKETSNFVAMAVSHGTNMGGGVFSRAIVHSLLSRVMENATKFAKVADIPACIKTWYDTTYIGACNMHGKPVGSVGILCLFPVLGSGSWFGFGRRPKQIACIYFGCGDENLMVLLIVDLLSLTTVGWRVEP